MTARDPITAGPTTTASAPISAPSCTMTGPTSRAEESMRQPAPTSGQGAGAARRRAKWSSTTRSDRARRSLSFERSKAPPRRNASLLGTPRSARPRRSSRREVTARSSARTMQETGTSEQATPDVKGQVAES